MALARVRGLVDLGLVVVFLAVAGFRLVTLPPSSGVVSLAASFAPGSSNDADDTYLFWFHPETGQMEQFGYDFDGGLRFRQVVESTRIGGVLFSTQENYAINGVNMSVDSLSAIFVSTNMKLLSTVVISEVTVERL